MPAVLATAILSTALIGNLRAETVPPGQVDFGTFSPSSGAEFVEVNITSSLIGLVSSFVERKDTELSQLLKGLHQVRVNVIGMTDDNRSDLEKRAEGVCSKLDKNGWEQVVRVQQQDQNVRVYLKTLNKDTVQGLVVLAVDGNKQAVFVNIVGDIKPSQLSMLGDKLHIDPLKKIGLATKEGGKAEN
jgi:Na+-translocating ferredoxin:NAD+ oxidoreductase RnfG subunit